MPRIAVLTSGGDAPGMNAALRTIAKVAAVHGVEVIGFEDGYDGLIDGRTRPLTRKTAGGLATTPELGLTCLVQSRLRQMVVMMFADDERSFVISTTS